MGNKNNYKVDRKINYLYVEITIRLSPTFI